MVKKIITVVGSLLVLLVVVALIATALQPSEFRVSRSAKMKATPNQVFAHVNDFHQWGAWSPWEKLDPKMERTFSGADAGKGAKYAWQGDKVGAGSMEIVESKPGELILIDLRFTKPFEGICPTEIKFAPSGDETEVTWTMSGTNNFVGKFFTLFMNMDKMVGKDFESGLAQMKEIVEQDPRKSESPVDPPANPTPEPPATNP